MYSYFMDTHKGHASGINDPKKKREDAKNKKGEFGKHRGSPSSICQILGIIFKITIVNR